jgi:hypothetical protein
MEGDRRRRSRVPCHRLLEATQGKSHLKTLLEKNDTWNKIKYTGSLLKVKICSLVLQLYHKIVKEKEILLPAFFLFTKQFLKEKLVASCSQNNW